VEFRKRKAERQAVNADRETPDVRQLAAAVNFFLKQIIKRFTVESCTEALVLTLAQFIQFKSFLGYRWESDRQAEHRFKITLDQGTVRSEREALPEAQIRQGEPSGEPGDNLILTLHRSLKSFKSDPVARKTLEQQGCSAALEMNFSYYERPIFWAVLGLANHRSVASDETQEFLLLFCRCCLVSLHGVYLAETQEREGLREKPQPEECFKLFLQWFHSVVRHLNIGISRLDNGDVNEARDALERTSIVAGVCLAEIVSLMNEIQGLEPGVRIQNSGARIQESG
jgi:hypothetical protein